MPSHTSAFSISAWIQDSTASSVVAATYHRIVSWTDGAYNIQLGLCCSNMTGLTGGNGFYIQNTNTSAIFLFGAPVNNSNLVQHVVGTFDGTNYHLYLNGVWSDIITNPLMTAYGSTLFTNANCWIGQRGNGAGVIGTLAAVGIWNRALSQSEITLLYHEGQPWTTRQLGNPVGLYQRLTKP